MNDSNTREKAVKLTRYFKALPSSFNTLALLVVLGVAFGFAGELLIVGKSDFFSLLFGASAGLFLVTVPAVLAAFTTALFKRQLSFRRMVFLSFACAFVYSIFYLLAGVVSALGIPVLGGSLGFIIVGYGFVFVLWWFIGKIVFGLRYSSFLFASVQALYNLAFLLAAVVLLKPVFVGDVGVVDPASLLVKIYFSSLVFLAAAYAIFWLVNAPMKRNFGVSSVDAVSFFLAQWLRQSKDLESLFESVGQDVVTIVDVAAFKAKGQLKALFVVPHVHFGPFGNLGGSDYPKLISRLLEDKLGAPVFVFHGTATHDFNPTFSADAKKIAFASEKALERVVFRKAVGSLEFEKNGTSRVHCIRFNDSALFGLSRAPRTTEDIDFSLGLALKNKALSLGLKRAVVIDAHNAETGEIVYVESGDPIGFEYSDAMEKILSSKSNNNAVKLGVSVDNLSGLGKECGVGENGLRAAVFSVQNKSYAVLLFDANGITPAFRRELLDAVKERTGVGVCEVYTTDTHSINTVSSVLNPLGSSRKQELTDAAVKAVLNAFKNSSEVEAGVESERVKINVFGVNQSSELIGTVNSIVAIMRLLVPLVLIGSVLLVLWGITRL
ncbi:DUF2070 family protein [Candidatus Micrarchaeota archaeon]|nr:DUF2070 family protein [Candidatus Micrarchaeota archaeon]